MSTKVFICCLRTLLTAQGLLKPVAVTRLHPMQLCDCCKSFARLVVLVTARSRVRGSAWHEDFVSGIHGPLPSVPEACTMAWILSFGTITIRSAKHQVISKSQLQSRLRCLNAPRSHKDSQRRERDDARDAELVDLVTPRQSGAELEVHCEVDNHSRKNRYQRQRQLSRAEQLLA